MMNFDCLRMIVEEEFTERLHIDQLWIVEENEVIEARLEDHVGESIARLRDRSMEVAIGCERVRAIRQTIGDSQLRCAQKYRLSNRLETI